jgi:hypothetical protein
LKISDGKIDQNYIYTILKDKRNFYSEMKKVQIAFKPYINIIHNNQPQVSEWTDIPFMDTICYNGLIKLKSKFFYNKILDIHKLPNRYIDKWRRDYINKDINFEKCFCLMIKQIKDHKIAEFNFKIYYNFLPTNENLYRWKISNTPKCSFCEHKGDTIHLLFSCNNVNKLWSALRDHHYITYTDTFELFFKVFFNENQRYCIAFAISVFVYVIYTEYLNCKDSTYKNFYSFKKSICDRLNYKRLIYYSIGWTDICNEIDKIMQYIS